MIALDLGNLWDDTLMVGLFAIATARDPVNAPLMLSVFLTGSTVMDVHASELTPFVTWGT